MAVRIKDVQKRVKALLEQDRLLADNDSKLITMIWDQDLIILGYDRSLLCFQFLTIYAENKLTSAESVRRSRQICECSYPNLRGDTYNIRHGKKAKDVKEEVAEVQFKAHLDSKYTQITPEILYTLKAGDDVYYTHPNTELGTIIFNDKCNRLFLDRC